MQPAGGNPGITVIMQSAPAMGEYRIFVSVCTTQSHASNTCRNISVTAIDN